MSKLTVDDLWIVGEPSKGGQLVNSVIGWIGENTGWVPDADARKDIDKLYQEVIEKYDHVGEGYYVFATQIIDSVLSRMYPYLVNYAQVNNLRIQAGRKEELIDGVQQVVIYSLSVSSANEPAPEDTENPDQIAPDNPYPLSPEIDPSGVPIDPDSPIDVSPPPFQGIPYDPVNPLRREPSPYVPRSDPSNIPYEPGGWFNPESPIQTGDPGDNEGRSPRPEDELPRAGNYEIPYTPPAREEEIPPDEAPSGGEDEETPPIEGEPVRTDTSGIEALLLRILQEIIKQGQETRDTIAESTGIIQSAIVSTTTSIEETIESVTSWLGDVIQSQMDQMTGILSDIERSIGDSQDEATDIEKETDSILSDAIETASEFLDNTLDVLGSLLEGAIDGVSAVLTSIEVAILTGLDALGEGIVDAITGFYDIYFTGQEKLFSFITDGLTLDSEDINKYLCEFLTAIAGIKDQCAWLRSRSS